MKFKRFGVILLFALLFTVPAPIASADVEQIQDEIIADNYKPKFPNALNIKETMTLSPMFTPDNALAIHKAWMDLAENTIDIQNQYITPFDISSSKPSTDFSTDGSPIIQGIVAANDRGVDVRIQVNHKDEDFSKDSLSNADRNTMRLYQWLNDLTHVTVKFMATGSTQDPIYGFLGDTHNKLVIIDSETILVSSINFGENAFTNNREAGMVIQSATAATHFETIFNFDWGIGEDLPAVTGDTSTEEDTSISYDYSSHTTIPRTNFTGEFNITLFTNPDNADDVVFEYLKNAKESVFVSMYTISRPGFNDTLIDLKKANPAMDIQVLISKRRVGAYENIDTKAAAESLVANLIPVYNSTSDDDKADGFYHNKYWIIDGKHTFIYSGNWSPHSVSDPAERNEDGEYSSERNRDMGVAVHDNTDIASFVKTEVWDKDVAVGSAWELPVGVSQTAFDESEVIDGTVDISAALGGLDGATVSYAWNDGTYTDFTASLSATFDTTTLDNGINELHVKAVHNTLGTFTDSVKVNVVNIGEEDNWRVLITELISNPDAVSDTEGEFFEITNSFPFDILMSGWSVGDDNDFFVFSKGYVFEAYSSLVFGRDESGFNGAYGMTADHVFSFSLTNGGDLIQLLDYDDQYVDVVAFGDETAMDGSEVLAAPEAGESIHRDPMHIDTNKASDFAYGDPDPKGTVPQVSLGDTGDPTDTEDPYGTVVVPFEFLWSLALVPVIPRFVRKRK